MRLAALMDQRCSAKLSNMGALSIEEMVRGWLNELFCQNIADGLINNNLTGDLDIVALLQRPTLHNPYLKMAELLAFLHIHPEQLSGRKAKRVRHIPIINDRYQNRRTVTSDF